MKLLTKAITDKLPAFGATENIDDPIVQVKFFTPWSNWTWYAIEYDTDTEMFYGLVDGFEKELGYFSKAELESITGSFGLKIERDSYFTPKPLSEVK